MGDIKLEDLKPGKLKPKISPKACVIMVGSTNTGKSTTVNIMTKSTDCMVGKITDTKPCTQIPKLVERDTELIYMDNPGKPTQFLPKHEYYQLFALMKKTK